ncbi:MAG: TonB family protein [Deltaproteobacteria bacterium]|nr:TonB family protein [Deltaproteobacteria bacterium]
MSPRDLGRLVKLLHETLPEARHARLLARLEREPELAAAYEEMQRAQGACDHVAEEQPPAPSWREMETCLHWRLAQEKPTQPTSEGRRLSWRWAALGITAAAALGLVVGVVISKEGPSPTPTRSLQAVEVPSPVPSPPLAPPVVEQELAALAILLSGDVRVLPATGTAIAPLTLQRPLVVGDRVLTKKDGTATLQWQQNTGVLLRSNAELAFSHLTSNEQRLRLFSGEAFFEVQRLEPNQHFEVIAGGLRVEVVGTRFSLRLTRDTTELQVDHGAVRATPIDEQTQKARGPSVKVKEGQRLRIQRASGEAVQPMQAKPIQVTLEPALHLVRWRGLHRVLANTGVLRVTSRPRGAQLRLDGRMLGETNLALRAAEGRHLVELTRHGRLIERRWVQIANAKPAKVTLRIKVKDPVRKVVKPPVAADLGATSIHELFRRRAPLIRSCYQRRAKRNPWLAGKVVLRIRIDATGRVQKAAIAKNTLGDSGVAECVQAMVRSWAFPKGQAATVTYPFVFRR